MLLITGFSLLIAFCYCYSSCKPRHPLFLQPPQKEMSLPLLKEVRAHFSLLSCNTLGWKREGQEGACSHCWGRSRSRSCLCLCRESPFTLWERHQQLCPCKTASAAEPPVPVLPYQCSSKHWARQASYSDCRWNRTGPLVQCQLLDSHS